MVTLVSFLERLFIFVQTMEDTDKELGWVVILDLPDRIIGRDSKRKNLLDPIVTRLTLLVPQNSKIAQPDVLEWMGETASVTKARAEHIEGAG